jgi:hypothetical protein
MAKFKVTRVWNVMADNIQDALVKAKKGQHKKVNIRRLK